MSAPLGVSREDLNAVEGLVRRAGTSFYRGMRVLPPDRRHAMYAIYAFCRIVDDIADEDGPLPDKLRGLAAWRSHVSRLYRDWPNKDRANKDWVSKDGDSTDWPNKDWPNKDSPNKDWPNNDWQVGDRPAAVRRDPRARSVGLRRPFAGGVPEHHPVTDNRANDARDLKTHPISRSDAANPPEPRPPGHETAWGEFDAPVIRVLAAAAEKFRLRETDFAAVIDGMRMDAETVIVAPDLATLDLYCDRVASAVGRLSVRAFGDSSDDADKVAYSLGRALQLTNILRDIEEDAGRGRLYLPAEYLDEAGVPRDPAAALASPALPVVCARVAADAHRHFRNARAHMAKCDPVAMKPARLMGETYAAILTCLEQSEWRDPSRRVSLPLWRKVWLLIRYGIG